MLLFRLYTKLSIYPKHTFFNEFLAQLQAHWVVHLQHRNGRTTGGSQADQKCPLPAEVILPSILARVKQSHNLSVGGINSRQVRSLVLVTSHASQREVCLDGRPAMLSRDDMLDLKRRQCNPSVFAPLTGSPTDKFCQRLVHARSGRRRLGLKRRPGA